MIETLVEVVSGDLISHEVPETLYQVQMRTVSRHRNQAETVFVLHQEPIQLWGCMRWCVVPNHKEEVIRIHIQQVLPVLLDFLMSFVGIYLIQTLTAGIFQ